MQMMRARCVKCEWEFDVVAIPMEATAACKTMMDRSTCPMCGNSKGNTTAPPRDLTDEESRHKMKLVPESMR